VGLYADARMHVPAAVVQAGVAQARRLEADGCLSIGGGSSIGLGKAIARETGISLVCVPTTWSGSEMRPMWGITEKGRSGLAATHVYCRGSHLRPRANARTLTGDIGSERGQRACSRCRGALRPDASQLIASMAEGAVSCLAGALPQTVNAPSSMRALAGFVRSLVGGSLSGCNDDVVAPQDVSCPRSKHGPFQAEAHAVVLPHVAAFNLAAAPQTHAATARALGTPDPVRV
jgi:maleylacetate reductase